MVLGKLGVASWLLGCGVVIAAAACGTSSDAADDDGDAGGSSGAQTSSSSSSSGGTSRADSGTPDGGGPRVDGGDSGPGDAVVPSQLTCLAGHFAGTIVDLSELDDAGADAGTLYDAGSFDAGANASEPLEPARPASRWGLRLPSGKILPWDDGRAKSFEETLERPDLQDTLFMRYQPGTIVPVNTPNEDPGRIRHDELFKAAYGGSKTAVAARIETLDFVGQDVEFHELAEAALARVSAKLVDLVEADPTMEKYVTGELGGTFEWRPILNTNRLSVHSFGSAIDIRVQYSAYWEWAGEDFEWENQIPQKIVDVFESEQFIWGGRWYHYDTMHFEYRPELFDPACRL